MDKRTYSSIIMMNIRNNFLTGLIVCAPIAITIWLTLSLINWVDNFINLYIPERYMYSSIPGFGLLIAVIVINLVGLLGRNLIGRSIVNFGEAIINYTPLVRSLYKSSKQIIQTILKDKTNSFTKVGLVEYPGPGIWSLCFISTDVQGELKEKFYEKNFEDMVTVFIPPTPLPTAGMLLFIPRNKITILDMSVEDALKFLISCGLITPEKKDKLLSDNSKI
ncbi:hypothetical protein B488_06860 [Liberibacter crescens BT-1]|uniref:Transporter n=1 Tax=Liberibacter crescens (strain BT-1) TaxID=1215343 RepID=L0EVI7_LIBCB|nr:DUF502 domain-containing protein [Liberibacter crescens]AGA64678.1 hypothetical protein B488_06860 [Liberibacter crescens BT-1]AMC12778.1 membrane protein [Liberibacter crescens]